jgi:hypothetical protein
MADDGIIDIEETDPRRIILELERKLRPGPEGMDISGIVKYLDTLEHAYDSFGLPFPINVPKDVDYSSSRQLFSEMTGEIDKLKIDVLRAKLKERTSVQLDNAWRDKIHTYLEIIRKIVESASLSDAIRDRIIEKLHDLKKEVDRNRAPIQKFTDILVGICEGISSGAEALTPAVRVLERVIGALSRVNSSEKPTLSLPKPEDFGLDESGTDGGTGLP